MCLQPWQQVQILWLSFGTHSPCVGVFCPYACNSYSTHHGILGCKIQVTTLPIFFSLFPLPFSFPLSLIQNLTLCGSIYDCMGIKH